MVTRRILLSCAATSFPYYLSLVAGCSYLNRNSVSWNQFADRLQDLSNSGFGSQGSEEHYAHVIGSLLRALRTDDPFLARLMADYADDKDRQPELRIIDRRKHFEVLLISFERGEEIPFHDHPHMTGVMRCIQGDVLVEGLEIVSTVMPAQEYLIKKTSVKHLSTGAISTLTSTRDNIHRLEATRPSQVLDVFSPPYDADHNRPLRWYTVERLKDGLYRAVVRS